MDDDDSDDNDGDNNNDDDNDDDPDNGEEMPGQDISVQDPMIPVDVPTQEEPAPPPNMVNEVPLPVLNNTEDEHTEPEGVPFVDDTTYYNKEVYKL